MPFAQRENIGAFCEAVRQLGVMDINNFTPDDLFEAKRMKQVLICILSLGKLSYTIPGYAGPCLGQREVADSSNSAGARSPFQRQNCGKEGGGQQQPAAPIRQDSASKKYKWDVKPGGSYVPTVPSIVQREAQERDREQHTHQRKWEVKFAPQLATASRRTAVMSSDVQSLMDQFENEGQLRTAMGGGGGFAPKRPSAKPGTSPPQQKMVEGDEQQDEYDDEDDEYDDDESGDLATAYCGVPPAGVVEGLMMMLTAPDPTAKAKAAAALCNICSETDSNRELVVQAGGLPSLIDMLVHP